MNADQLSKRLETVADFLQKPIRFADIGSDHAYLPCFVCQNDPEAFAIAGELNKGPYLSALEEVKKRQLNHQIEVIQGNGLEVIDNRINQIVIAGMGGPLITEILDEGKDKLTHVSKIITQPNIDARSIRKWLIDHEYNLVNEVILEEGGHVYEILVAEKGEPKKNYEEKLLERQLWLGPHLLKEKNSAFYKKWEEEKEKKHQIVEQMKRASEPDFEKIKQFKKEISWLEEVL
ncbi:tRNA (adenine(22)-N(1))-methyltransferase [Halobacillus andaensis]|uniref:tRNA (Adenine(22)-N(1))-methyltransferase n=1 Tax=Halobacillus andaensis TaxID=1176239 RepID=A0A917AYK9_HALAA|nr:tRNA (adenine(22)-N(1))-methyltransferase TrmK [Halobacillus andaensis]MBP2003067.1 tRNA (adenine22-N1)-methyltransferase [Halobacillus andaensis]GGF07773.1 tRNA (adenine(22)-N(1))-methyltransferase [Halobacillus andaensis]